MLFSRNGSLPQPLPAYGVVGASGTLYSPISADDAGAMADCGFAPADDAPAYDANTQVLAWAAGAWSITDIPADILKAAAIAAALTALAARRWAAILAFSFNGLPIALDDETQARLTAAYVAAKNVPGYSTEWQIAPGQFVSLDTQTLVTLGEAALAHVSGCFSNSKALATQITAADDPASVSLESGWPS